MTEKEREREATREFLDKLFLDKGKVKIIFLLAGYAAFSKASEEVIASALAKESKTYLRYAFRYAQQTKARLAEVEETEGPGYTATCAAENLLARILTETGGEDG